MCRSLSGRFIGDPTYEYEYIDVKVVGEGEEAEEETNTVNSMLFHRFILLFKLATCIYSLVASTVCPVPAKLLVCVARYNSIMLKVFAYIIYASFP